MRKFANALSFAKNLQVDLFTKKGFHVEKLNQETLPELRIKMVIGTLFLKEQYIKRIV